MAISLQLIVAGLVTAVVLLVGGACIGVTLATTLAAIDQVGQGFANELASAARDGAAAYWERREANSKAGCTFFNKNIGMDPMDYYRSSNGGNWTNILAPFLTFENSKLNYSVNSITIVTPLSGSWMYSARSRVAPNELVGLETINFFHEPASAGATVAVASYDAKYYSMSNGTLTMPQKDPYGRWGGFATESEKYNIDPRLAEQASFLQLRGILVNLKKARRTPALVMSPIHIWLPEVGASGTFWQSLLVHACYNSSGAYIANYMISLPSSLALRTLLLSLPRTKGGHLIITEASVSLGLLATTVTNVPWFESNVASNGALPPNSDCSNSYSSSPHIQPAHLGCRKNKKTFAYAPFQNLDDATASTETTATSVVDGGDEDYYVVVKRLTTKFASGKFQIFAFVPKSDVLGAAANVAPIVAGASAGIMVLGILVAVVIVIAVLRTLDEVSTKMLETSKLEGLDDDESLEEDEEEQHDKDGGADNSGTASPSSTNAAHSPLGTSQQQQQSGGGGSSSSSSSSSAAAAISGISEIAALQLAYAASHRNLVNFTRYLPKKVVKHLLYSPEGANLIPVSSVTATSTDIRGFTTLCEKTSPDTLSRILVEYFQRASRLVPAHGGIIQMFVGDCIIGLFGAPFPVANHELLGTLFAIALDREVKKNPLKQTFLDVNFELAVRTGVASGPGIAGAVGSSARVQYSLLGPTMATTNGIEPFAKEFGVSMIVDEGTARSVHEAIGLRLLINVKVPGRQEPTLVYEPIGLLSGATKSVLGGDANSELASATGSQVSASTASSGLSKMGGGAGDGGDDENSDAVEVDFAKLMNWHRKRNSADDRQVNFAAAFSDAARMFIDFDFGGCGKKLDEIAQDGGFSVEQKTHKSMATLRKFAAEYKKAQEEHDSQFIKQHSDAKGQAFVDA